MDFSELMSHGKVTIPVGIQKKLNLKEGDKVVFSEKEIKHTVNFFLRLPARLV